METTDRFGLPLLQPGQAQKEITHNEALLMLDIIGQIAIADRDLSAPPSSPGLGHCWIVASSPTGAWVGKAGSIACWTQGGWRFIAPRAGMVAWIVDEGRFGSYDGVAWSAAAWPVGGIAVNGLQVVGPQGAAIANPTGGATVDAEARTALNTLLGALRTHGLIAT
jgi:Protein of unknown function (DUF2793)